MNQAQSKREELRPGDQRVSCVPETGSSALAQKNYMTGMNIL